MISYLSKCGATCYASIAHLVHALDKVYNFLQQYTRNSPISVEVIDWCGS